MCVCFVAVSVFFCVGFYINLQFSKFKFFVSCQSEGNFPFRMHNARIVRGFRSHCGICIGACCQQYNCTQLCKRVCVGVCVCVGVYLCQKFAYIAASSLNISIQTHTGKSHFNFACCLPRFSSKSFPPLLCCSARGVRRRGWGGCTSGIFLH